jgi:TolB protein
VTFARTAVALAIAVSTGCKKKAQQQQQPDPADGVDRIDARTAITPAVAALPGAIWFVEDGPPPTLQRLAGGRRTTLGENLYPAAARLGDGQQVAIWSLGNGEPGSEQIALVGSDGAVTRVGTAATQVRAPAVDPAGAWIVVAANLDGHSDLYRIDLATPGDQVRITSNDQGNFHPTPLGSSAIAFASSRDGDSEIYRSDLAGKQVQRLTAFHRDDWDPVASPDGKTIAFLSDREGPARIFLMAADGTAQRRLTTRSDPDYEETELAWSPDSTRLAYIVAKESDRRAFVTTIATRAEIPLATPDSARDAEPSFSPDGRWIVVSRATTDASRDETFDLYAIPSAGGTALQLTVGGGDEGLPRWMP